MMRSATVIFALGVIFGLTLFAFGGEKTNPAVYRSLENSQTARVWIFFVDKGEDTGLQKTLTAQNLTERARKRRLLRNPDGPLVDRFDLPVAGSYLRELREAGIRVQRKSRWLNAVTATVELADLAAIEALPSVKKILPVRRYRNLRPTEMTPYEQPLRKKSGTSTFSYGGSLDQNQLINVVALHDLGLSGAGVTIAMLDAGFNNLGHEAFANLTILHTWDFVNNDPVVEDEPGQAGTGNHGTNTLSTIGGFKEGSLIGPAFGANYLLAKTENTDSESHVEEDNWVAAAEWADSLGADIISSSLGYREMDDPTTDYTSEDMDGNTAIVTIGADIAASRGILVVNSAGNEFEAAPPENSLVAPCDGDSVLAIGATDRNGIRSFFSSTGPSWDGRVKPNVAAMGSSVVVASAGGTNRYSTSSGTSFSCPLTAGAAALLWEYQPNLTNMEIIQLLQSTANQANNPDRFLGYGVIDALAAYQNILTNIGDPNPNVARTLELEPAYPNPFNPATTIRYSVYRTAEVRLSVVNLLGQELDVLVEGSKDQGRYIARWEPGDVPSGIYFVVLSAGRESHSRKVVFLK